jgi:uncharacterized membrane protein
MLSSINYWMSSVGLLYLVSGVFMFRKDIRAACGWDKLIALGPVFMAVPLAVFGTDHLCGPRPIADIVPSWMPAHLFWTYFVGCALLAAATSLTARTSVGLSSTLLGLMFFLFVCMMHIPNVIADPKDRFTWAVLVRDLSFAGAAWAFAGMHIRVSWPQLSQWMTAFGRVVVALAALVFAFEHFLHPAFAPGFPSEALTPSWVPFPSLWGYLAGAILLASGLGMALNMKSRTAALCFGTLMTFLTLFLYLPMWFLARGGSMLEVNQQIDNVFDTLLFAGAALLLASALPRDSGRAQQI